MDFNLKKVLLSVVIFINTFQASSFAMNYREDDTVKESFLIGTNKISAQVANNVTNKMRTSGYDISYHDTWTMFGDSQNYFRRNTNELESVYKGGDTNSQARGFCKYIFNGDQQNLDSYDREVISGTIREALGSFRKKTVSERFTGFFGFGRSIFSGIGSFLRFGNRAAQVVSAIFLSLGIYSRCFQHDTRGWDYVGYGSMGLVITYVIGKMLKKRN